MHHHKKKMAGNRHLVLATVVEVHHAPVVYPSCTSCYTKLQHLPHLQKFHCARCQGMYESSEVHQRYRLVLTVSGQEMRKEVTIFGSCLDTFFGVDATTFSRYMDHLKQHHPTSQDVWDLVHQSLKDTFVGHPFYFGFKSSDSFPTALAPNSNGENHLNRKDSVIAVQMMCPFRKWTSGTVLQRAVCIMAMQLTPEFDVKEMKRVCECEHDLCPLRFIIKESGHVEQAESRTEGLSQSGMSVHPRSAESRRSVNQDGSEVASYLEGASLGLSVLSCRLSCDERSVRSMDEDGGSISRILSSQERQSELQQGRSSRNDFKDLDCVPPEHSSSSLDTTCGIQPTNLQAPMNTTPMTQGQDSSFLRRNEEAIVTGHIDHLENDHESHATHKCMSQRGEGSVVNDDSQDIHELKHTHVDLSYSKDRSQFINRNPAPDILHNVSDNRVGNLSYEYKQCNQPDDSFHRCVLKTDDIQPESNTEHIGTCSALSECCEPCSEKQTTFLQNASSYDFPDDLPFSEDLEQFLQDMEEEYVQAKQVNRNAESLGKDLHSTDDYKVMQEEQHTAEVSILHSITKVTEDKIEQILPQSDITECNNEEEIDDYNSHCTAIDGLNDDDVQSDGSSCNFADVSQSPVLFSQSQSPIAPYKPLVCHQRSHQKRVAAAKCTETQFKVFLTNPTAAAKMAPSRKLNHLDLERESSRENGGENQSQSSPLLGSPSLFSQMSNKKSAPSSGHRTASSKRRLRKPHQAWERATPLRERFLQKAISRKLCSTPRERAADNSPPCGTPDLFSSDGSLQSMRSVCRSIPAGKVPDQSETELSELAESFECTPDLF